MSRVAPLCANENSVTGATKQVLAIVIIITFTARDKDAPSTEWE